MKRRVVFGILVGGAGQRMGGLAKGLLAGPRGLPIVEQLLHCCRKVAPKERVVLLGTRPEYAYLKLPQLADQPLGAGPLGGLHALLLDAYEHTADAILLGCDLPYVNAQLLGRLYDASEHVAVAPHIDGRWNPVFARYQSQAALVQVSALLSANQLSMQRVLEALHAHALALNSTEIAALRDWDTPEDVAQ